jgi:predicted MFS family arabinose efflux permease
MAIMAAVFLLGAADRSVLGSPYVITVFIVAAVSYSGLGVYSVMSYCLPYYVMDMKEYGKVTATCAILSGVVSFAVSLLHTLLVAGMDYMQAMVAFFALAIISIIMTTVTCLLLKEKAPDLQVGRTAKEEVLAVFKNKDTYFLILPNFARGLSVGIMNVITVIAMANSIVNEQTASYINVLMQVAMLGGNLLYIVLYRRLSSRTILILSATLTSVFLPLCLGGGLEWFLTAFFVAYLMRMIVDTTIPVMITEIIPQNQIGAYTSIRMLIFTGAQAVATMIITPLVGIIGYVGLLIFAGAMQMVCGLAYWLVAKYHASKKEI